MSAARNRPLRLTALLGEWGANSEDLWFALLDAVLAPQHQLKVTPSAIALPADQQTAVRDGTCCGAHTERSLHAC